MRSEKDKADILVGIWILKARAKDGKESPATLRQMKITFRKDGTFLFQYRGDAAQQWIDAGDGGYSYIPPVLQFFWDTGQRQSLLVLEQDSSKLRLHHGRNLVPLKDQDPDEIFVKEESSRPAAKSS